MNPHLSGVATMDLRLPAEVTRLTGCLASLKCTTSRRRHPAEKDEDPYVLPNAFIGDQAKLTSSKSYRLMPLKTQVLTKPRNPMIRTRNTHVMEVVACSKVMADLLGLNTDLAEAIALGHDIGHVPFGHQGEIYLAEAMGKKGKFCHEIFGVVVAQHIERHGRGLNLTHETLEGMLGHSGNFAHPGMTQEAWVVRYMDKAAYLFADWNDVVRRLNLRVPDELTTLVNSFGSTQRERTSTMMAGLMFESAECGRVSFEQSEVAKRFARLRQLMYDVYVCVTEQNPRHTLEPILEWLASTKVGNSYLMLALMTDRDVEFLAQQPMKNLSHLHETALGEILDYLPDFASLDLCDPDLNW